MAMANECLFYSLRGTELYAPTVALRATWQEHLLNRLRNEYEGEGLEVYKLLDLFLPPCSLCAC